MGTNTMSVQRQPFPRSLLAQVKQHYLAILAIVVVAILAYGILIPWLGFYFDDWIILYLRNMHGASGLIAGVMEDRPGAAPVYIIAFSLFGNNPLLWHLYAFAVRLCGALVLYWGLNRLWSKRYLFNTICALAFLVYPGLLIQVPVLMYVTYQTCLLLSVISFVLTICAVTTSNRLRQVIFTIISTIVALIACVILEEFIVFEVIRALILLYIAYTRRENNRLIPILRTAILWYLPYVPLTAGFLFWRIFVFKGVRVTTDVASALSAYRTNTLRSLLRLPSLTAFNAFEMTVLGWFAPAYDRIASAAGERQTLYYAIFAIALAFVWLLVHRIDRSSEEDPPRISLESLILSIFVLLGGLWLITLVGRRVYLLDEATHFATTSLLGVALVAASFIMLAVKKSWRPFFISLLIAIAVATQFADADAYRAAWDRQQAMWSQIQTRIPALEPGTVVVVDYPRSPHRPRDDSRVDYMNVDYEVWGPLKMLYGDQVGARLSTDTLYREVESGVTVHETVRSIELNDNLRHVVAVFMPEDGSCLRVLDSNRLEFPELAFPEEVMGTSRAIAPFSNTNLILPSAPGDAAQTFTPLRPTQTDWCYYFERADLARQIGDWKTVAALWNEAKAKNLQTQDMTEYYPFIESFIRSGQFAQAMPLMAKVVVNYPNGAFDLGRMVGRILMETAL